MYRLIGQPELLKEINRTRVFDILRKERRISRPQLARMTGHSLFARDGGSERGLMLGNTYRGQTLFVLASGRLMVCAETLLRWLNWPNLPSAVAECPIVSSVRL